MMHCWFKKKSCKSFASIYRKWLRYYLNFCQKYNFKQSDKESLSHFIKKLKEKNQTDQQQKQAFHAISIYFDIEFTDKDKNILLKNKKRILSSKKDELKSTNADWRPVYSALNAEIKLRHYSPKTFQSYRSSIIYLVPFLPFLNFSQRVDPHNPASNGGKVEFPACLA